MEFRRYNVYYLLDISICINGHFYYENTFFRSRRFRTRKSFEE